MICPPPATLTVVCPLLPLCLQAQLEAATASEQLKGAVDKAGRAEEREAKQVQSAKDDAAQVICPLPPSLPPHTLLWCPLRGVTPPPYAQGTTAQMQAPPPSHSCPGPPNRVPSDDAAQVKRLEQERDKLQRQLGRLTAAAGKDPSKQSSSDVDEQVVLPPPLRVFCPCW